MMLKIAAVLFLSGRCGVLLCCWSLRSCFVVGCVSRPEGDFLSCLSLLIHTYSFSLIAL